MPEQFYGTGRRKTSTARVFLRPAKNSGRTAQNPNMTVNKLGLTEYFERESSQLIICQPLHILNDALGINFAGMFDIYVTVEGGGKSGQAGAVRLGLCRALYQWAAIEYGAILSFEDVGPASQTARRLAKMEKYGTGFASDLLKVDEDIQDNEQFVAFRKLLRENGFLTRDSRKVERKKYGRPGARKRFQFSKR